MKYTSLCLIVIGFIVSACAGGSEIPATPTLDALQLQGQAVYNLRCAQCHALAPDTIVIGPSMAGIATRAADRIAGYSAEEYIEDSILFPKDYIVEGFTDTMPTNFGKDLTSEEFSAVVAYLLTLK